MRKKDLFKEFHPHFGLTDEALKAPFIFLFLLLLLLLQTHCFHHFNYQLCLYSLEIYFA